MLDRVVLASVKQPLGLLAAWLDSKGCRADPVTLVGLSIGLMAPLAIAVGQPWLALIPMALNRLADGLDGELARRQGPTHRGAFLDVVSDFLFYASVPLGFAIAEPQVNGWAAAVLLFSFMGTASSFLAFAVFAARRGIKNPAYPTKGFYYLGGLTEATETLLVFTLMCLQPDLFVPLALGFAGLCLLTTVTRIVAGVRLLD
jgi:phosphatidylglycerophosphate synthase